VDGGTNQVTCSYGINGHATACSTSFNVIRPNASVMPTITGQVQLLTNPPNYPCIYLELCGTNDGTTFIPGIEFALTNVDTNGWYFLVQIGTLHRDIKYISIYKSSVDETTGPALDAGINPTNWFYPFYLASTNVACDSPFEFCSPDMSTLCRTDYFNMYLMFSNFTLNAMPVPLKVVNWSWSGNATNQSQSQTHWVLTNSTSSNSPPTDTFTFPQWTNNVNPGQIFIPN
jgi:hypothetical protein